jgi:hypothetical protein
MGLEFRPKKKKQERKKYIERWGTKWAGRLGFFGWSAQLGHIAFFLFYFFLFSFVFCDFSLFLEIKMHIILPLIAAYLRGVYICVDFFHSIQHTFKFSWYYLSMHVSLWPLAIVCCAMIP